MYAADYAEAVQKCGHLIMGCGFVQMHDPRNEQVFTGFALVIAVWQVAAISLVAAALPAVFYLRRRRVRGVGFCRACGYDLSRDVRSLSGMWDDD